VKFFFPSISGASEGTPTKLEVAPASVSSACSATSGKSANSNQSRRRKKKKQASPSNQKQKISPRSGSASDAASPDHSVHFQHCNLAKMSIGSGGGRGPPAVGYNMCVRVGKISVVVDKLRVDRTRVRLAEVEIGDETGSVSLRARGEQIDLLQEIANENGSVVLRNAVVELFQGRHIRLAVTRWGKMTRSPDGIASTPPEPKEINRDPENLSELDVSASFRSASDVAKSQSQSEQSSITETVSQQPQAEPSRRAKEHQEGRNKGSPANARKSRQGRQRKNQHYHNNKSSSSQKFQSDGADQATQHLSTQSQLSNQPGYYRYVASSTVNTQGVSNQQHIYSHPPYHHHHPGVGRPNRQQHGKSPRRNPKMQSVYTQGSKGRQRQQHLTSPSVMRQGGGGMGSPYAVGLQPQPGSITSAMPTTYSNLPSASMIAATTSPSHFQGHAIHPSSPRKDSQQQQFGMVSGPQLSQYQPPMMPPPHHHQPQLIVMDGNYVVADAAAVSSPTHHGFPSAPAIDESPGYVLVRGAQYAGQTQQTSHGWHQELPSAGAQMDPRTTAYDPSQPYSDQVPYYGYDPNMYPMYPGGMMFMPPAPHLPDIAPLTAADELDKDLIKSVNNLAIEGQPSTQSSEMNGCNQPLPKKGNTTVRPNLNNGAPPETPSA